MRDNYFLSLFTEVQFGIERRPSLVWDIFLDNVNSSKNMTISDRQSVVKAVNKDKKQIKILQTILFMIF